MITESDLNEKMATPEAKARIKRYVDSLKASPFDRSIATIIATKRVMLEIARGIESH